MKELKTLQLLLLQYHTDYLLRRRYTNSALMITDIVKNWSIEYDHKKLNDYLKLYEFENEKLNWWFF